MFLSILKFIVLVAVILLVGQIRIGKNTIAGHFQGEVNKVVVKSHDQLMQTKMLAGVTTAPWVEEWLNKLRPPKEKEAPVEKDVTGDDAEAISPSDRESILRILQ